MQAAIKCKYFLPLFFALFIAFQGRAQVIGTVNQYGVPTLTFSSSELLESWNEMLINGGIDAQLTNVTITREDGYYYLVAHGGEYYSNSLLQLDSQTGNLYLHVSEGTKTTCTSRACAYNTGCSAQTNGTCSRCNSDPTDCTKSSSTSPYLF